jgi:aryl-alcohol dehydrogenase-like predicted oxidoreductase
MKHRALGSTGITVSEIGFGTWGLGGDAYGPADDAVSIAAIHHAMDRGINFFDTSDLYGAGHSESVLGEALTGRRDRAVISTKVGLLPHSGFLMPTNFSAAHIRNGLDESLRRLRTDYVDLYHLHSPELSQLREAPEIVDTLHYLQTAGKIRAFGLSARSPADALAALQDYRFAFVQANYNLIDQRCADDGLFAFAKQTQIGIIARTPLCFGYLTGKLSGDDPFIGRDHRANWPVDQLRRWAGAPDLFNQLFGGSTGRSATQLALRFCLEEPTVSSVIPGMMNIHEVDENVSASALPPLGAAELYDIRMIYCGNSFFDRTAKQKGKQ